MQWPSALSVTNLQYYRQCSIIVHTDRKGRIVLRPTVDTSPFAMVQNLTNLHHHNLSHVAYVHSHSLDSHLAHSNIVVCCTRSCIWCVFHWRARIVCIKVAIYFSMILQPKTLIHHHIHSLRKRVVMLPDPASSDRSIGDKSIDLSVPSVSWQEQ